MTGFALYGQSNPSGSFPACGRYHLVAWLIVTFLVLYLDTVSHDTCLYNKRLVDSMLSGYRYLEPGDHAHDQ